MRGGTLRSLLTIQRPIETPDLKGGKTITGWVGIHDVWAEIDPTSARRYTNQDQLEMLGYHTIKMRYTSKLVPGCRLVKDDRAFYISSIVNPGGRNKELVVTCTEEIGNATP